jgi:hypothetical protein
MCVVRHTLAKGAFWRSIGTKKHGRPSTKAMANNKNKKRGNLGQSTTYCLGRNVRREVEYHGSFQGRALGCCGTMHRLNWGEIGVRI